MNSKKTVQSANIHLFGGCNYECSFCISRCLTKECMRPEGWIPILEYLKGIGVSKINLAGGEPVLYPYLDEIVDLIWGYGFVVTIVSNGSLIDSEFLRRFAGRISWIGLSLDSPDEEDEIMLGRHCMGVRHVAHIMDVAEEARGLGYNVKLNITVTRNGWNKDFRPLIEDMRPKRIKAFRALTVKNANDDVEDTWSITDEQFAFFRDRHRGIEGMVFEDNCDMIDTYLMFDPLGNWMVNSKGIKRFLPFEQLVRDGPNSILDIDGYYARNAVYDWNERRG
ncbi:MAG: viperin family antiviral radical SAM protein [Candidatus Methanomethylophilaceae archaeon]|nr:viperin family antiviral radical SAM protein [Candidatus Methanomethylophilaceae archaeon]